MTQGALKCRFGMVMTQEASKEDRKVGSKISGILY